MDCIDCTSEDTPFVLKTPPTNVSFAPATSVVIAYVRQVERTEEYDSECDAINNSYCITGNPSQTPFAYTPVPVIPSKPKRNIRRKLSYSECD